MMAVSTAEVVPEAEKVELKPKVDKPVAELYKLTPAYISSVLDQISQSLRVIRKLNEHVEELNDNLKVTTVFIIDRNTRVLASTNLASRDIEIEDHSWLSVGIAVDTAGAILSVRFFKEGDFFALNNSITLKANTLYSFTLETDPGDFINFRLDTALTMKRFIVRHQKRYSGP